MYSLSVLTQASHFAELTSLDTQTRSEQGFAGLMNDHFHSKYAEMIHELFDRKNPRFQMDSKTGEVLRGALEKSTPIARKTDEPRYYVSPRDLIRLEDADLTKTTIKEVLRRDR